MTNQIQTALAQILARAQTATDDKWDYEARSAFAMVSSSDVPGLVQAVEALLEFVNAVDIGCYDPPWKVQEHIAKILTDEQEGA